MGPGVFSLGLPKHNLPKLGRKWERKLCKIFWTKIPIQAPCVYVPNFVSYSFLKKKKNSNWTWAWPLFLTALFFFPLIGHDFLFFLFGMVVLLFCFLTVHDWFFRLVEFLFLFF